MTRTLNPDWPVQLRLPGQAAAPEGPVDMHMMYVMHRGFRRDLDKFVSAVQHTPADDRRTWTLLADRWQVFAEVLHKHHSGEDAGLWPWLIEHGTDEDRGTLEAMETEHDAIDPLLGLCANGFARLKDATDEDARAALAVRLVATRETLGRHLEHEECDAITIIQRLMTQEDWDAIDEEYFKQDLTPRYIAKIVPWAAYGVPRDVLDDVFAKTGLGFKLVWFATRRRFAAREAQAFRYAS